MCDTISISDLENDFALQKRNNAKLDIIFRQDSSRTLETLPLFESSFSSLTHDHEEEEDEYVRMISDIDYNIHDNDDDADYDIIEIEEDEEEEDAFTLNCEHDEEDWDDDLTLNEEDFSPLEQVNEDTHLVQLKSCMKKGRKSKSKKGSKSKSKKDRKSKRSSSSSSSSSRKKKTIKVFLPNSPKFIKRKRSIAFRKKRDIVSIIPVTDMISSNDELWYQPEEFDLMVDNAYGDVYQRIEGNTSQCTRGLENMIDLDGYDERVHRAIDTVLDEQEDQFAEHRFDEATIAKLYSVVTSECKIEARLQAEADARAVMGYLQI